MNLHNTVLDLEHQIYALVGEGAPTGTAANANVGTEYTDRTTGDFWKMRSDTGWTLLAASSGSSSVAWSAITGKPTTIAGFGITDAFTQSAADSRYLQLTGGTLTGTITTRTMVVQSGYALQGPGNGSGFIQARNAANTSYVDLLYMDSSDVARIPRALTVGSNLSTSGQFSTNQAVSASDLVLRGSPASVRQIQFGDSSVVGSVGTTYSGGWAYLAYNAYQVTQAADSWGQNYPSVGSTRFAVSLSGLALYAAGAGKATSNDATFWGSSVFTVTANGSGTFTGTLNVGSGGYVNQAGDLNVSRAGATSGVVYFGSNNNANLYWSGSYYYFGGAGAVVVQGGYGANAAVSYLTFGANGGSPNAASLSWGDGSGWVFNMGPSISGSFTPRFSFYDTGNFNAAGIIRSTSTYGWAMGNPASVPRINFAAASSTAFAMLTGADTYADLYLNDVWVGAGGHGLRSSDSGGAILRFGASGAVGYLDFFSGDATIAGFRMNFNGTIKGYLYADGSGFGLLNNVGNWAVMCNYGASLGGTLSGVWNLNYSGASHTAPIAGVVTSTVAPTSSDLYPPNTIWLVT